MPNRRRKKLSHPFKCPTGLKKLSHPFKSPTGLENREWQLIKITQHCEYGVNFPQKESSICPPTGKPHSNSDLIVQTRATKNLQHPQHAELYPAFGGSNLQPGNWSEVPQDISRFIKGFKYDTWLIFLHYTRTQKPANNQGKDKKNIRTKGWAGLSTSRQCIN